MQLSREDILRMVGLTGKQSLGDMFNYINETLEGNGDALERYWTQIVKNEKEITLIAGREAENETNIAQLQITAQQISARVTTVSNSVDTLTGVVNGHTTKIGELEVTDSQISASVSTVSQSVDTLTGTVNTHTTKIGQLEITDSQIQASVSTLSDTVSGHTTKIGQLEVSDSNIRASVTTVSNNLDTLSGTVAGHTTKIGQLETTDSQIQASVSSLTTTVDGHTQSISSLTIRANSLNARVEDIEDDYVVSADLSLYVTKDKVSWLTGSANNVIFDFTNVFQIQSNGTAVMEITSNGDLKITGNLEENSEIGTVQPMRVNSNGELERKTPEGTWAANYAGRYVKSKSSNYTCVKTDDFIVSNSTSSDITITLPANPSSGKIITIQNTGRTTKISNGTGSSGIKTGGSTLTYVELQNYDRGEFVFDGSYWYAVYISGF